MALANYVERFLPQIEIELKTIVDMAGGPGMEVYRQMLAYHMGWEGKGAGPAATGKRLRPLLTLIACEAAGGDARKAQPAAAGVELIHNFSLIHDDIQDNSLLRRGRETVWVRWGLAQAINAGDAMFTLAWLSGPRMLDLGVPADTVLAVTNTLATALLRITQGQHLDIAFEARNQVSVQEYIGMIGGKTAQLVSAAIVVGALVAGAPEQAVEAYRAFGYHLGLAFQIQDDLLGIWGEPEITGKSAASDLSTRKKSLPVVFGSQQSRAFAQRFSAAPLEGEDLTPLLAALEAVGADEYAHAEAKRCTEQALAHLEAVHPTAEAGDALRELAAHLIRRKL